MGVDLQLRQSAPECIVYTYLMIPPMKKVATMLFEERMVTYEKWLKYFSWQMTLRLKLSEPPCVPKPQSLLAPPNIRVKASQSVCLTSLKVPQSITEHLHPRAS